MGAMLKTEQLSWHKARNEDLTRIATEARDDEHAPIVVYSHASVRTILEHFDAVTFDQQLS